MKSDFLIALTQLAAERHLSKDQVLQAIEAALASAFKKDSLVVGQNVSVKLNPNNGEVNVFATKTVVEEVEDENREVSLVEAQRTKPSIQLGHELPVDTLPHQVSRIAAQTAKQVVLQRLREVERDLVYQEFAQRTDDVVSGVVDQIEAGRVVVLELGRAQAILTPDEQVPMERYRKGQRLKVYVVEVTRSPRGPEIVVSRSHKNLLKRLFEIEVPEVFNGVVEIKAIAREAGSRSKVAVVSLQDGIDPVGSCIGMRGNRIQSIVNELQGEKIDVVRWDKDIKQLISNALSPSEVVHVEMDDENSALVVVPERQLSLAIGKEGQNARLAAKLTGFHLDIKSMSEWEEIRAARQSQEEARRAAVRVLKETGTALAEDEALGLEAQIQEALAVAALPGKALIEGEPVVAEVLEAVAEAEPPMEAIEVAEVPPAIEEPVAQPATTSKLTPKEEMALLALEEAELQAVQDPEEDDEEEAEGEGAVDEIWRVAVPAAPGAGQIRFAEDIMGEVRGRGGRGGRKAKGGSKGPARGGRR
jgi:N utilization substance protein A